MCHLGRLLGERTLKISDVARETGINRGTLRRLYQETVERIEVDAIDRLCGYLGVRVAELLEFQREEYALRAPGLITEWLLRISTS